MSHPADPNRPDGCNCAWSCNDSCALCAPPRKPLTGAQILAVAGTLSAIVGTVGGFLDSAQIIGIASAIMLAGNVFAFNVEKRR